MKNVLAGAFGQVGWELQRSLAMPRLQARFSLRLPDWQQGVTRMLHEIL